MRFFTYLALLTLLPVNVIYASPNEFRPLEGHYSLSDSNIGDESVKGKYDRVLLFIEGAAAREMYDAINKNPIKDRCSNDLMSKKVGNLICSRIDNGKYFCTLGIGLKNGKIVNGSIC